MEVVKELTSLVGSANGQWKYLSIIKVKDEIRKAQKRKPGQRMLWEKIVTSINFAR